MSLADEVARTAVSGPKEGPLYDVWREAQENPAAREQVTGRLFQGLLNAVIQLAREVDELKRQVQKSD